MALTATWYRVPEAETNPGEYRAKLLSTECRRLRDNQSARRDMYQYLIEQYSCAETQNLGLTTYDSSQTFDAPTMPFNIVRRGVNTVYAKCAKNKPLPMVLASHGDYKINKRARGLTNFLAGLFAQLKVPSEVSAPVCKFAEVIGTGCAHVYETPTSEFPEVYVAFPWEVWVPVSEGRNGTPRTFYMQRYVDVDELVRMYGKDKREEIEKAAGRDTDDSWSDESETGNLVLVYYGWRLALDDKHPGMYSVSIGDVELDGGEYKETYPPFAFLRYNRPLIGFWGEGLAVELVGFQYELNFTTESLRMSHRTAPTGVWVTPDPSGIPDPAFSNDIGYILKHKPGFEPKYYNPTPAPPQTYDWHDRLSEGGLRWSGISTMSANAEKPPGITAAVALNTLDDIEADNFAVFQQDYEQFHLDLSNLLIDSMKRIAKKNPDAKILVQDKRSVLEVVWSDVDMPRDAILMQTFPVALLGRTPAARRDMVAGLFKDGIIDRSLYLKLLDAPDIDAEVDLDAATRTLVDDQLEKMLDAEDPDALGVYQHPMPFTDLVYALRRATQQVCLGTLQKRPEANLALLRDYIEEAKLELKRQNADENAMNPPPPMPPGMPPPGAPGAMPPGMMAPPPPPDATGLPPGAAPGGIVQ